MPKFRNKPVVIEAVQWEGNIESEDAVSEFIGKEVVVGTDPDIILIEAPEGVMAASVGDWIIKGLNGEFYPCKPDIFAKTYDFVE